MNQAPNPFAQYMPTVARNLLGNPNPHHSKDGKPRWGRKGSLAIDEVQGTWYDHENGAGGGVLDLIEREKKLSGSAAIEWLNEIGCHIDSAKNRVTEKPGSKNGHAVARTRKTVETYDYIDLDGAIALQVCRMGFVAADGKLMLSSSGKLDKSFMQRRPYPGKHLYPTWIWGASAGDYMRKGPGQHWYKFNETGWAKLPATRERKMFDAARIIPYRLPELTEAIASDHPVFVVEGEQKVDALATWNLHATCNAGGAGKWTADHAAHLKDADVTIIPDNDSAGQSHADQVARSLQGIASRVRVLKLPGLKPKGDIVDWQKRGTREDFETLLAQAPDWQSQTEKHLSSGGQVPQQPTGEHSPVAAFDSASASSFAMTGITWLWQNRFALGKLGLIAGLPDRGKGLITADITARTTTGDLWPCGEGRALQGRVLMLSAEDDIEDTIIPRLVAAGADLDRVEIVRMVHQHGGKRMFSLVTDLELLRQKVDQFGDVVLVIIDPMSAYLGVGKVDSYRTTDVRGVLAPLVEFAAEKRLSVIGVLHFNKKADVHNAMLRISDSLAFAATARHCYVVVDDLENERKLFVKAKNNLAADTKGLSYAFNTLVVGQDKRTGEDIWAPRVAWGLEHVEVTATEAMEAEAGGKSRAVAKDNAEAFLRELLADGPVAKRDIEEAADANGISERTLRRAQTDLGIVAKKSGLKSGWNWQLPDEPARKVSRDE